MPRKNPFETISESTITKGILKMLKKDYPGTWYKIHGGPYQERGIPDIIGCHQGVFCGIEVKKPEKRSNTTTYQEDQLSSIHESGGLSGVVTSIEETRTLMDNYFE